MDATQQRQRALGPGHQAADIESAVGQQGMLQVVAGQEAVHGREHALDFGLVGRDDVAEFAAQSRGLVDRGLQFLAAERAQRQLAAIGHHHLDRLDVA